MTVGAIGERRASLRPHFWAGLALLLVGHFLIFSRTAQGDHVRPFSDYWFAAVWFGYIFVVDAFVYKRDGRSLFVSHRAAFLAMLPLSGALWVGFEKVNEIVQNWHYERPYDIPEWWATVVSWIFFSTVIPAVWETADWLRGTRAIGAMRMRKQLALPDWVVAVLIGLGVLSFVLPAIWPLYFFPLIWGFLFLILDPINYKRGVPSILGEIGRGDWRVPVSLYIGGHICGILWEFWNFWAFPRWFYTVPFVGFIKIFEMPLLGYIGYGPFALEIFAFFWFVWGFFRKRPPDDATSTLEVG